jgi:hypothetical protein
MPRRGSDTRTEALRPSLELDRTQTIESGAYGPVIATLTVRLSGFSHSSALDEL